jgi:hypothetical protein
MDQLHKWLGYQDLKETDLNDVVHGEINAWQERFIISVRSREIPGLINEIRSARKKVEAGLIPVFKRCQSETEKAFNYWYEEERNAASTMLKRYQRSLVNFASASSGAGSLELEDLMNFAVVTMHEIKSTLKERGTKDEDALYQKLVEFLRSAEFKNAPYIRISAML